jgi:hypothetical protein
LQALQSVGQIVGEVLRQLTEEKFIVKVGSSALFFYYVYTNKKIPYHPKSFAAALLSRCHFLGEMKRRGQREEKCTCIANKTDY